MTSTTDTTSDDSGFDPGWLGLLGLAGLAGLMKRRETTVHRDAPARR
jgi:MYXO-CTERM domain-containing protein